MLPSAPIQPRSLKRARSGSDDGEDVSIISRSPSPMEEDSDDVDMEVITTETRIKPTNKGFALLTKLGWSDGQPLGLSGEGRVDPIPFHFKADATGLGKISQDVEMVEATVSQRRELDSERFSRQTLEQKEARLHDAARRSVIDAEISETLRAFYCALCDKQFKHVAQYDEHTNSYSHHHKARLNDMKANIRVQPKEEIDKRKAKEQRREEKELRKIAKANGIKIPKSLSAGQSAETAVEDTMAPPPPPGNGSWVRVTTVAESPPAPVAIPSTDDNSTPDSSAISIDALSAESNLDTTAVDGIKPTASKGSTSAGRQMGWQKFQLSNSRSRR